ncbi:hypothetical protein CPLU01_02901 [Colletotrichum plurivorum]|uniref:Uncharacterized protein n=1 Tax=Colletotrichum plurivorum TaxID=2175906 RepID=A0A8H6KUA8_9PEZI|nr:hypothetical protein CPLU01_02901 [Colletotrichum plurivorum]
MASRTAILPGSLQLIMPEHGAYDQARAEQKQIATEMVVCRDGQLPIFSIDAVPTPSEWDNHRLTAERLAAQRREVSQKVQQVPVNTHDSPKAPRLATILHLIPAGAVILDTLWHDDAASIGSLATASKKCSEAVALYVASTPSLLYDVFLLLTARPQSRFNLPRGDYQGCNSPIEGFNEILEEGVETPSLHTTLFVRGREASAPFATGKSALGVWASESRRENLWNYAQELKGNLVGAYLKMVPFLRYEEALARLEAKLDSKTASHGIIPYTIETRAHLLREFNYVLPMLRSFEQCGSNLRAVRFHQVPMMDVRVLELLLPTMPKLEVLGLIDCELLHFASVNPILDVLHWNSIKVQKKLKLDFYPRSYSPPSQQRQGTYFLSWESLDMDSVPMAVLLTTFIAVLKAHPMGIDLISEGQAFRKFLNRIPMKPGAMWIFIDALSAWLHACRHKNYKTLPPHMKQQLHDQLFMALHQGETLDKRQHRKDAGQMWHCSKCGRSMVTELFCWGSRARPANQRLCRACDLQSNLSAEKHHLLWEKRDLLTSLLEPEVCDVLGEPSSSETAKPAANYHEKQLRNALAPMMPNPFVIDPPVNSEHCCDALDARLGLPELKKLLSPEWDLHTLNASGEAAAVDLVFRLEEFNFRFLDHGDLTNQKICRPRDFKQSWEHNLWKDMDLPSGPAQQAQHAPNAQHAQQTAPAEDVKAPGFW